MEGFVRSNAREVRGWVLAVGFKKWPPRAAERAGHPPETCFGAYFRAQLSFSVSSCHFRSAPSMEETNSGSKAAEPLSLRLKGVLQEIHNEECPHVPNPLGCKKRASVALVIRIRPPFRQEAVFDQEKCSSSAQPFQASLVNFFSQSWVQHGDPEVLFIKRAARAGDRWTSHVAFPGGKRDPGDSDDRATSIRETMEETGLNLDTDHSLFIGNLPERVIRMMWGETP